jgi:hypothetical protein
MRKNLSSKMTPKLNWSTMPCKVLKRNIGELKPIPGFKNPPLIIDSILGTLAEARKAEEMLTNHENSESEREAEAAKVFRRKHPVNALKPTRI